MSASDDEEALFDDIYGEEEQVEDKKEEEQKEVSETPTGTSHSDEKASEEQQSEETNSTVEAKTEQSAETVETTSKTDEQSIPPVPSSSGTVSSGNDQFKPKADLSRDAGKMFIGGLDWDTTEDRLKEYFSKFGEVIDHTIMRESSTGRSRGFGFLTFADSRSVDEVVKTQHVLDGKVIDPKRAIPREEQDKTGKIFVGGIAPEVRPKEFEEFFSKFGTIIDAQLMLDKDTGRSRGFGFVTFDTPEAVDRVCQGKYLDFNGRQIEVKRAEPRGPQQQQNHIQQQQQRFMQQQGFAAGAVPAAQTNAYYGGVTPEAMTQYWQQMQQYWLQLQQQGGAGAAVAGMPNLQQMQQFQQMQQQQQPVDDGGEDEDGYRKRAEPPVNAPRGPRNGGNRPPRGRRGGGYRSGGYHPYRK